MKKEFPVSEELADALEPLLARELDLWLEQRHLYRRLVEAGQHRGVPPPQKPRHRLVRKRKSTEHVDAKTAPARAPRLVRAFPASVVEGTDGRTVEALVVPWDRPARVADAPDYQPYQEVWRRGAFDEQLDGRPKVFVNVEHEAGVRGLVGHAVDLHDRPDGLHATLRILDTEDGTKTLALVREGILDGLSLEAIAQTSRRTTEGVVERVRAKLKAVALCRSPAFADARVLAVRDRVR